jgi:hypothetical protein
VGWSPLPPEFPARLQFVDLGEMRYLFCGCNEMRSVLCNGLFLVVWSPNLFRCRFVLGVVLFWGFVGYSCRAFSGDLLNLATKFLSVPLLSRFASFPILKAEEFTTSSLEPMDCRYVEPL